MNEYPDSEQSHHSNSATGVYKIGHHSIRIMKWLAYYDRSYYEKINYYYPLASVLSCLNKLFEW